MNGDSKMENGVNMQAPKTKPKGKNNKAKMLIPVLVVILLAVGVFAYTTNTKLQKSKEEVTRLSDPKAVAKQEADSLTITVGKLVEIPANETPTIATVSDATKLSVQPFFAGAQNGDKFLYFPQAKKAVLYRPSTNKIINYGTVNIDQTKKQ